MEFSKTTKVINGVTKDALYVDRKDGSIAQTFTKAEINDIRLNTQLHDARIKATKAIDDPEYIFFCQKDETGKSFIDKSLSDHDTMVTQCSSLVIN